MLRLDWNKFKYFYRVVQFGKINKAAQSFGMSQSTLSRQIAALEEELGFELLVRSISGVELTVKGEAVYKRIKDSFFQLEQIFDIIADLETLANGKLVVTADNGLIDTWLSYYIPEFLNEYPEMKLTIKSCGNPETILKEGADIICSRLMPQSNDYSHELLMTWNRALYASKDYLKNHGRPKTIADLDNHKLIAFEESNPNSDDEINWHLLAGRNQSNPRDPVLSINSIHSIISAAKDGVGIISFCEESPLLKDCGLVRVLPDINGPSLNTYLIMLRENQDIARFQTFKNFFKTKANQLSPYIAK